MTRRKITLTVDRITVSGERLSEHALTTAIRTELGRLLADAGTISPSAASIRHIDGGRVAGGGTSTAVGHAVARVAMGALNR